MKHGRLILLVLVLVGAALSYGLLFYAARDGGISRDNLMRAIVAFLGVYLPLIGVMAGFAFGRGKGGKPEPTIDVRLPLVLAFVLVGVQSFSPGLLLLLFGDINSVLAMLNTAAPGSQPVSLGAVAYFYSKS